MAAETSDLLWVGVLAERLLQLWPPFGLVGPLFSNGGFGICGLRFSAPGIGCFNTKSRNWKSSVLAEGDEL